MSEFLRAQQTVNFHSHASNSLGRLLPSLIEIKLEC